MIALRCPYGLALVWGLSGMSTAQELAPDTRSPTPETGPREDRWPLVLDAGDEHIVVYQP
jgi:hypothetical protein